MVRNRVKRLLRVAFRTLRADITRPLDVVLIAKPVAAELTLALALAELRSVLPRMNGGGAPRPAPGGAGTPPTTPERRRQG